jgi:5,10-methylenetetrahydromethanopterin reductase
METAWKNNGRDPKTLYSVLGTGGCVLDDGESADSPRALAQAGPYAAIIFHNVVEQEQFGSVFDKNKNAQFPFPEELEAYRKVYQSYQPADARYLSNHRGHLMFLRPEEKHITGKVLRGFTLTGTRAELVDRLRGIKQAGYNQIQFHTVPGHENDMLQRWADVMAKV